MSYSIEEWIYYEHSYYHILCRLVFNSKNKFNFWLEDRLDKSCRQDGVKQNNNYIGRLR